MDGIDGGSSGRLHGYGDESAEGQGESYAGGVPATRCEISGEKWTETGLNVGEEEVEPLDGAETAALVLWGIRQLNLSVRFALASNFRNASGFEARSSRSVAQRCGGIADDVKQAGTKAIWTLRFN